MEYTKDEILDMLKYLRTAYDKLDGIESNIDDHIVEDVNDMRYHASYIKGAVSEAMEHMDELIEIMSEYADEINEDEEDEE